MRCQQERLRCSFDAGSAFQHRPAFLLATSYRAASRYRDSETQNQKVPVEGRSFGSTFMKRSTKNQARKTILVVDDDKQIASALSVRLKASGYDVVTSGDGFKGLAAAMDLRPNLIVMDIWLPGAIGLVVAERLKDVGLEDVPIIFMTASKKEDLWRLAQEVGSVAFFDKPYDPEELLAAIARELDENPARSCDSLLFKNTHRQSRNEKSTHR